MRPAAQVIGDVTVSSRRFDNLRASLATHSLETGLRMSNEWMETVEQLHALYVSQLTLTVRKCSCLSRVGGSTVSAAAGSGAGRTLLASAVTAKS